MFARLITAAALSVWGAAASLPNASATPAGGGVTTSSAGGDERQEKIAVQDGEAPKDVVVVGRLPRCKMRPDDPVDSVNVATSSFVRKKMTIVPAPSGDGFSVVKDTDPVTGPVFWQRVGTGLDQYVFRIPADDTPLCLGARGKAPIGYVQLRRELNAVSFRGKYVRFTVWAATRRVGTATFWLATGDDGGVMIGEVSSNQPLEGDHRWTPVSLSIGRIPRCATKLSYGWTLSGPGDIWLLHPNLEIIAEPSGAGADLKDLDPHCKAAAKARADR